MTRYAFHGACHTGRGHLEARRREMAALLFPPSLITSMIAFCWLLLALPLAPPYTTRAG